MKSSLKCLAFSSALIFLSACMISGSGPQGPYTPPPVGPYGPPGGTISAPSNAPNPQGRADGTSSRRGPVFPYKFVPDNITILTCSSNQIIGSDPFSLSLGVYRTGLQLSENFKREHSITKNTPSQKVRHFIESSPYKDLPAWLTLYDKSDLRRPIQMNDRYIKRSFPFFYAPNVLNELSHLRPVHYPRTGRVRNNSGTFRASLPVTTSVLVNRLIDGLQVDSYGNELLALVFGHENEDGSIQAIRASRDEDLYGRGYKLDFNDPLKADYLVDIQEEDLSTGELEGRWRCSREERFMVHRATREEDSGFNKYRNRYDIPEGTLKEGYCAPKSPSRDEARYFEVEFGPKWNSYLTVGTTVIFDDRDGTEKAYPTKQPCIVFKNRGCYQKHNSQFARIEFDPEKQDECARMNQIRYRDDQYRFCPAYLSVCHRYQN